MMIDTHCHLDEEDYENIEQVISHMDGNYMIASGCNLKTNKRVIDLINKYDNIYGTIGVHPEEIDDSIEENLSFIRENITNPKIVGVGEIGLDFHYCPDNKELQKKYFIEQINIAKEYNKTVVIHSRDAVCDTYDILDKYIGNNKVTLHCYGYDKGWALRFKKFNIKFGIGGVLTFKNARKMLEVVDFLNLEDIILETDSPYLTPEPFRGKTNEPYNIIYVANKIAELKGISTEKVLDITTKNAIKHFDLDI